MAHSILLLLLLLLLLTEHSDGLQTYCKICDAYRMRERKPKPFSMLDNASAAEAYCSVCGELKPACDFARKNSVRSGRHTTCKQCRKRYNGIHAAKKAPKVMNRLQECWQRAPCRTMSA